MSQENLDITEAYLEAIHRRDLEAVGKNLHPQLHFKAPMSETHDRDSFLQIIMRLFPILKRVEIHSRFAASHQTFYLYDMIFDEPLGLSRTANLMTFEGGLIKKIELVYDARPFEKFFQEQKKADHHELVQHLKL